MDDEDYNSDNEDFEEDDEETHSLEYKSSYVIVAIDTHPSMFVRDENGNLPFRNCLESCYRIMDSLILVSDRRSWNPFAVFLKREDSKFINFDNNMISSVKLLQSKLKLSDQELEDEFQRKSDYDLAEFLLECKKAFHDIKAAFYKRTLIFITNDDNPVKDAQSKFAAINEVKSFDASQISFQIIPTNEAFDFKLLYNEILALLDSYEYSKEEICTDVDGLEQKLSSVLLPKQNKTKVHFYPFKDDSTRYLTCFNMKLSKSKNLLNKKLTVDGKEVKPSQPDATLDLPTYTLQTQNPLAQEVVFDYVEKDSLSDTSFPRGYTLIYIGKMLMTPGHCYSSPQVLQVHPSEQTDYFKKFWDYCVQNDRVLITIVKHKKLSAIKFCQMSPILIGDTPTFLCKVIPYGNHIIMPPEEELPKVEKDEEKEKIVQKMIDRLTIEFHPDMIPNPKYRKKLLYVKSKLLDEPFDDEDIKVFDKKSLDDRIRNEVEEVKKAFGFTEFDSTSNTKRKKPATTSAGSRKKKA